MGPQSLLTFRERLAELASEYERLQAKCDTLAADNESLREALVSARGQHTHPTFVASATEQRHIAPSPKASLSCARAVALPSAAIAAREDDSQALVTKLEDLETAASRDELLPILAKPAEADGPDNYHQMLLALDRNRATEGSDAAGSTQPVLTLATLPTTGTLDDSIAKNCAIVARKSGESGSSYSESSSEDSSAGRSRSRRARRRRKHRRKSRERHRRGRKDRGRKDRDRDRDRDKDRKRSQSRGKKLANLGNFGSGSHEADVHEFISKNQLDPKVCASLRALKESDQKKIMGTDGGQNSFVLIDRVKNPNGVVTSRINKLMAEKR